MILAEAALSGTPQTAAAAAEAASNVAELSLWDLCLRGGPLMIPLALLSLICVYVFIERVIVISKANRLIP